MPYFSEPNYLSVPTLLELSGKLSNFIKKVVPLLAASLFIPHNVPKYDSVSAIEKSPYKEVSYKITAQVIQLDVSISHEFSLFTRKFA